MRRPWIVGVSGASGTPYAAAVLRGLLDAGESVDLIVSRAARLTLLDETGLAWHDDEASLTAWTGLSGDVRFWGPGDLAAGPSSGSYPTKGMVVVPASTSAVSGIAIGLSKDLLQRAADVTLKERRPLVVVPRETPLNRTHLVQQLALHDAAAVNVSVTSLDPNVQRVLEPRTSSPAARLETVATLRAAGIPVGVMVAPIIPGLTDHEVPRIVEACARAGAQFAGYTIVRLPWAIAPLFEHWLDEHFPERKQKVLERIRHIRGGTKLNDARWGTRTRGEGIFAEQIRSMFEVSCRRSGIGSRPQLSTAAFRRSREQLDLFR